MMKSLIRKIIKFRNDRDWKQFHNPKNLAESIVIESAELLELFQWKKTEKSNDLSEDRIEVIGEEMSDVLIYLLTLAHDLKIDLFQAAEDKLIENDKKYPVQKAKGNSKKYSDL